jgi:hypothetical protein
MIASHSFDDGLTTSGAYYFTDEMEWPGQGDVVPNFSRLDLKFNKHIDISGGNMDISLILQNFHKENIDFYNNDRVGSQNIWERRIYLQTSVSY